MEIPGVHGIITLKAPVSETYAKLVNYKGLHARASAKVAELVEAYADRNVVNVSLGVTSGCGGIADIYTDGDSIMGMLMISATREKYLHTIADGTGSGELVMAIENPVSNGFGEEIWKR